MELQERVTKIFSEDLHLDVPVSDADLIESGILDSLQFVDLLLHLEQEFGVAIPVAGLDIEQFRSIERIVEFLATRH